MENSEIKQQISNLQVGSKIYVATDKLPFKVIAFNDRYIIGIKPFAARKTFLYTIIDLVDGLRGPDDHFTKYNYDDPDECKLALIDLMAGELQISHRRRIRTELDITKIVNP